jgi:hypothetical protein
MDANKAVVIDIESSDLLSNMIDYSSFPYKLLPTANLWCVVIKNVGTGEIKTAVKEQITKEWFKESLQGVTHILAHNGIKFDFIVLKLFGVFDYSVGYFNESDTVFGNPVTFLDTLIISRLLNPDRFGGHSLDSWGERVGNHKTDFRGVCVEKGYIEKTDLPGTEFRKYVPEMLEYCIQDTEVNRLMFSILLNELAGYNKWHSSIKIEHKLADLAVRRETLGFYFDKELAINLLEDLTQKMQDLTNKVNPLLPRKLMTQAEIKTYTLPKKQFSIKGEPTAGLLKKLVTLDAHLSQDDLGYFCVYKDKLIRLPHLEPLETHVDASIDNLDHVKMYLIYLGWVPTEWRERDLTKDSKKQNISYEKRVAALDRWMKETLEGKYKKERLDIVGLSEATVYDVLLRRLEEDKPVRVPTSPCVRVGVEKDLCPNLVKLGDKVSFANDFSLYLTYKHRKNSIAGGGIEDMDFDLDTPNTGFLAMYREVDSRIPTPAIEIGASTSRYRHIGVCNIARASSIYGKDMRSLFGCGPGFLQFGYDFSSLEARINGHYVLKYKDGDELAKAMLAEKPNDIHSVNARKLGIPRSDAKSLTYGILYGAQPAKVSKMLGVPLDRAKEIYNEFWDAVPALKELKSNVENYWEGTGKQFIPGIDGRKINIRSKHSILNALFQSAGVICAKYVNVRSMEILERQGYCIDPFLGVPDVCEMIAYHDECQLLTKPNLIKFQTFETEELANEFVSSWEGSQLSAVAHGNSWYVALPNDISFAIDTAIKETGELLKLNVPLGFEWIVHKNWYGCH